MDISELDFTDTQMEYINTYIPLVFIKKDLYFTDQEMQNIADAVISGREVRIINKINDYNVDVWVSSGVSPRHPVNNEPGQYICFVKLSNCWGGVPRCDLWFFKDNDSTWQQEGDDY